MSNPINRKALYRCGNSIAQIVDYRDYRDGSITYEVNIFPRGDYTPIRGTFDSAGSPIEVYNNRLLNHTLEEITTEDFEFGYKGSLYLKKKYPEDEINILRENMITQIDKFIYETTKGEIK